MFSSGLADYADYQILSNGAKEASLPLLFHENWLDSVSAISINDTKQRTNRASTGVVNFRARNQSDLTGNPTLQLLANVALAA